MWKVDLKIFFKESWKKYGFVFLLVLVQCVGFRNLIQQYNTVNGQEWKLHFWDYVICLFSGDSSLYTIGRKETFNIPPYWSLYLIYFVLLIGKLTGQLSKKYEQQMLLRLKTETVVDGKSFENLAGMYGISGSDSNSISWFFPFCTKSAVEGINLELLKDYLGLEINKIISVFFNGSCIFVALLALAYIQYIVSLAINTVTGNFGFLLLFLIFQCISDPSVFNRKLFYVYASDDVCYG